MVVKDAVAEVEPVAFLGVRFVFAALVMWAIARRAPRDRRLWRDGTACGLALLAGYVFQTVGLQRTSATTSAFITYLLVVIVPVLSAAVLRRPPTAPTVAGIAIATAGLALLSGTGLELGAGEAWTLLCAVAFAVHIVLLASAAPRHDWRALTAVQMTVVGVGCALPGLLAGGYGFPTGAWAAALYSGVAASAIAFALMTWAQQRVSPSRAGLILMMEPVFAAAVAVAAGERFGARAAAGAALIVAGVVVSEGSPASVRRDG